jgi:Putative phage metallopeptidase
MTMTTEDEVVIGKPPLKGTLTLEEDSVSLSGPAKTPQTALAYVPDDEDFGTGDYCENNDLSARGFHLIATKNTLAHLKGQDVRFYWKKKGGQSSGKPNVAKAQKVSGFERFLTDVDWRIWLAADHCRGMSKHELEAWLFEALCHCGRDDDGNRVINPPDLVVHIEVIRQYGLVTPELRTAGKAMKQLGMDL